MGPPTDVREEIRRSPAFAAGVTELAARLHRGGADVARDAIRNVGEMMARPSRLGGAAFAVLERLLLRAYRVEFDAGDLERLRALDAKRSLVFLPSHRSYLDPMVLGLALRERGFARNYVLGGINLDFWPVGPLARRAGIVFIRRRIRDDEVYRLALRQYIGWLVEHRRNLEWYLEGGRSRTGKLRPPRFGLFAYLVDAYREGRSDDVTLVPVSIVYDQLHEVDEMAREARGAAKRPEDLRGLIRYARAQGRRLGAIHVRLGAPLSLHETLQVSSEPRLQVERAAIEVCHRINEITPITPASLVTLALLGVGDRALTVAEIRRVLRPLLDHVRRRGLPVTEPGLLEREGGLESALGEMLGHGVVQRWDDGLEPLYGIGPDQHLVAAYYRNTAIHQFLTRAVGELALAALAESEVVDDPFLEVWAEAQRLRDLLKFEFFFPRRTEYASQLLRELEAEGGGVTEECLLRALHMTRLHTAHSVLGSFLEAYWIVADRLAAHGDEAVEGPALVAECLAAGRQYVRQGRARSAESVSAELFGNALQLAHGRHLLGEGAAEGRAALLAELTALTRRLATIADLALRDLREPAP